MPVPAVFVMSPTTPSNSRRDVGEGACPPHTNACDPSPDPASPPSGSPAATQVPAGSSQQHGVVVARVFFAAGIVLIVLLAAFVVYFIHRCVPVSRSQLPGESGSNVIAVADGGINGKSSPAHAVALERNRGGRQKRAISRRARRRAGEGRRVSIN